MSTSSQPWYRELTRYHWFVLAVAALGWLFDTMDQQLFNFARAPAMNELLAPAPGVPADEGEVAFYGGLATSIFLIGWATGGLAFGVLGDRIGRAKTMLLTILLYSLFTGVSAFSQSFWDFALWRFLTGLGVGGEFAVGVSLVAEVMPERARPFALGLLQALSAVGNISAAVISIYIGHLDETGVVGEYVLLGVTMTAWRIMFLVGTVPALLAIVIRRRLKEPERWQATVAEGEAVRRGSYAELFGDPRWRKRAIVGMLLASSGVIGLWGIGFFVFELVRPVFAEVYRAEARARGDDGLDRDFVRQVWADPQELDGLKPTVKPSDLLGLEDRHNGDPQEIFGAIVALRKEEKAVTEAAALDKIDALRAAEKKPRQPQTAEERARRLEYLQGEPATSGGEPAKHAERITARAKTIRGSLTRWAGITGITLNVGAFFGIYVFSIATHYLGRRLAFAIAFVAAMLSTAMVFGYIDGSQAVVFGTKVFTDVFWMIPIMGFCQLSIFGGYAIYFPELFPTRLRSTGVSFCYNVGRYVAASGPTTLGLLTSVVFADYDQPIRAAGIAMCSVFLLGLFVLPFAPETRGQPLPE